MADRYADDEIAELLAEPKPLPKNWHSLLRLKPKHGHREAELTVQGDAGNVFRLIIRQSNFNVLDFSVILAYCPANSTQLFRLRRYNGRHEHTNQIEAERFHAFHIHEATERYQELGAKEEAYAQPTDRFSDIHGALECLFEDCMFVTPGDTQGLLFPDRSPLEDA